MRCRSAHDWAVGSSSGCGATTSPARPRPLGLLQWTVYQPLLRSRFVKDMNPKHVIMRRLAYWFTGVAIGLFVLGAIQLAKQSQLAKEAQLPPTAPLSNPSPTGQPAAVP